jgi:hypothetical protein
MDALWSHSITWRIAVGPQARRNVLTRQTLSAGDQAQAGGAGNVGGFSPHAGVAVPANQRNKRERVAHHQPPGAIHHFSTIANLRNTLDQ